jgi:hypothetical protein
MGALKYRPDDLRDPGLDSGHPRSVTQTLQSKM